MAFFAIFLLFSEVRVVRKREGFIDYFGKMSFKATPSG